MVRPRIGLVGASALVVAACADDPVPHPGGHGGAAGSGDATGAVASDCEALCDAAIALGCEDPTCSPDCVDAHDAAGQCQEPMASYVACLAAHAGELESCTVYPRACQLEHDGFFACGSAEGCGVVECPGAPEGSCTCQAFCSGTKYLERCAPAGDGFDCECEVDGVVARSCSASTNACAFFVGCCAPFFS